MFEKLKDKILGKGPDPDDELINSPDLKWDRRTQNWVDKDGCHYASKAQKERSVPVELEDWQIKAMPFKWQDVLEPGRLTDGLDDNTIINTRDRDTLTTRQMIRCLELYKQICLGYAHDENWEALGRLHHHMKTTEKFLWEQSQDPEFIKSLRRQLRVEYNRKVMEDIHTYDGWNRRPGETEGAYRYRKNLMTGIMALPDDTPEKIAESARKQLNSLYFRGYTDKNYSKLPLDDD